MIGRTLNHYKVLSRIGRGGMGEVFLAEDTRLGRKVALKVLTPEMATDGDRRSRFEREAKTIAALNHPNIVTVFSVENAEEIHFITMELVEGKSLTEILADKKLSVSQLLDYAVTLADAVTGAHRKGITHRDLKPDNVMLSNDGRLKVLDFGLAKVAGGVTHEETVTSLDTGNMTREGVILGTVAYMSPEQAEGKAVDARSDVFSLGVILYQMATGERPFQGDTTISTITAILRDEPEPISSFNTTLPRHLGRIIKRCLQKDPERRYQTAQDLRNDLQGLRDEVDSGELQTGELPAVASARPRPRWLIPLLAVVVLAVVAVLASQFAGRGATDDAAPALAPGPSRDMEIHRLTATGKAREATISAGGRYVAYVIDEAGRPGLWVTQVSTGSKVPIVAASETALWDPIFSPDGDHVYYCASEESVQRSDLFRVPTLGGSPRKVLDDVSGRVSFSPDGRQFVFHRSDQEESKLVVADIDGGNQRVISMTRASERYDDPAWSPDGKLIATSLATFTDEGPMATVVGISPEDGAQKRLTDKGWLFGVGEIAWLPDGSGVIVNANEAHKTEIWEIAYPGGQARRVINDLNSYHGVGLTANGETLITQLNQSTFNVWLLSMEDDSPPVQITSGADADDGSRLTWAPDGRIVYDSTVRGKWEIWTVEADGTNAQPLMATEAQNAGPAVSRDGKYIVFISNRTKAVNLFRANLDGGDVVQLTQGKLDVDPVVTPDSRWVVYLQPESGTLHKVPIDGGESVPVRDKRGNSPILSPDGERLIVHTYHEDRDRWLWDIVSLESGETVQTLEREGLKDVRWAPHGNAVTYTFDENDACNVYRWPLDGGEPEQLTNFERDHIREFQWSADGKHLVVSRGDTVQDIVLLRHFR